MDEVAQEIRRAAPRVKVETVAADLSSSAGVATLLAYVGDRPLDGLGLAYMFEEHVANHLARGELVRVLEDWCPPFDGYFLYYPSRRHQPPALQALVDALRV